MTVRTLIYARVSVVDSEVENQLVQLRQYAAAQNWQIVEEVVDVASGSKSDKERPGLAKVFLCAHQRKFDTLLIWALDRLTREGSRETRSEEHTSELQSLRHL